MKNFNRPFCEQLLVSVKKKRSRSNDLDSDEYSYSFFYSDPRIYEYSDTRSSPNYMNPPRLFVKKKMGRNHLKMFISQQNCHCFFIMVSEALSCILNSKIFLGEAPHTPQQEVGEPPSCTLPPRLVWHEQFSPISKVQVPSQFGG